MTAEDCCPRKHVGFELTDKGRKALVKKTKG
jgi:hypothetical protein